MADWLLAERLAPWFAALPTPRAAQDAALVQPVLAMQPVLARPTGHVVLLGTFKAGKSTLLNALLGAEVAPTRVLHATGTVTSVRAGAEPAAALLHRQPDGSTHRAPLAFDQRAAAILLPLDAPAAPDRSSADAPDIELTYPAAWLPPDWALVDTPGLSDTPALTARSMHEVQQADLVLMVLSAYQLLSIDERETIRSVQRLLAGNIACVLNQIDLIDPAERAEVQARAAYLLQGSGNELVGCPRLFVTAAHDPAAPGSGIPALAAWLATLLGGSQGAALRQRARLSVLLHRLEQAHATLDQAASEATAAAARLYAEAKAAHAARTAAMQRGVHDDMLRLDRFERRLEELLNQLLQSCVLRVAYALEMEHAWFAAWQHELRVGVHAFGQRVQAGAWAALAHTALEVPPFETEQLAIRTALDATANQFAVSGWLEETAADVTTPVAALLGGTLLGDLLGGLAVELRSAAHIEIARAAERTTRTVLPPLRQAALAYLAQVRAAVRAYGVVQQQMVALPSAALLAAEQRADETTRLAAWAQDFRDEVAALLRA